MRRFMLCGAAAVLLGAAVLTCATASGKPAGAVKWPKLERGYTRIYDGKDLEGWKQAGPGKVVRQDDGSLMTTGGMGLFWYAKKPYKNFILRVDWKAEKPESNSGVFVRFPDPGDDPWVAVNKGHEIQICDKGDAEHRTGAIYSFKGSTNVPTKTIGQWNTMEIQVSGQSYTVRINGQTVTRYFADRSLEGYVGLQNHSDNDKVWFRNVRVKELPD